MTMNAATTGTTRRSFLALGGMACLARAHGQDPAPPAGRTVADIVAAAAELATGIVREDPRSDEAWAFAATALLARLEEVPADPFTAMTAREEAFLAARGWTYRRVHAQRAPRDGANVITHQIWIPPGGQIPMHDHRDLFGAIVCVAGDVEVRSFDVVEGGVDTKEVILLESVRAWLRPGRYSLLTRARDNVHELRAGKDGARMLDLFAWLTPKSRSVELQLIEPLAATRPDRRYRAAWKAE
jgi:hypothetical protein